MDNTAALAPSGPARLTQINHASPAQAEQPMHVATAPDEGEPQERLLRIDEVERLTGIRKSSLYARIKAGGFPCPVRITKRSVAWPESRIRAWIQARIAEADQRTGALV